MSSTRLPGKVLADIHGKPMLRRVWDACAGPWKRIILTSDDPSDDVIAELCLENGGMDYRRGSLESPLSRYLGIAAEMRPLCLVRVCADAPFIQKEWIGKAADSCLMTHCPAFVPNALHAGSYISWGQAARSAMPGIDEHAGSPWFERYAYHLDLVPEGYLMVNTQEDLEEARRRWIAPASW